MIIDLDAIKARLVAATPGPWEWSIRSTRHMLTHRLSERASLTVLETGGCVEHAEYECANEADRDFIEHAPSDVASLIAEVERLRAVNADFRMMVDGLETARADERAAVVAFLRQRQPGWPAGSGGHADDIERGEHRREEEK